MNNTLVRIILLVVFVTLAVAYFRSSESQVRADGKPQPPCFPPMVCATK